MPTKYNSTSSKNYSPFWWWVLIDLLLLSMVVAVGTLGIYLFSVNKPRLSVAEEVPIAVPSPGDVISVSDTGAKVVWVDPATVQTPTPIPIEYASAAAPNIPEESSNIAQRYTTVLLLGIDRRPHETGPFRTDTMILVVVDKLNKKVGMLSIPRDLWVQIPGYGDDRINTAYVHGEAKLSGSGIDMVKRTVQYNFGVPVDYYALVNFQGFRDGIDAFGGVEIEVSQSIRDDAFPDDNYGYDPLYIPAGLQVMDGDTALKYARSRHGSSDFARAQRQQQLLVAVRDRALQIDVISKLPQLTATVRGNFETDMPVDTMISLIQLGNQIDSANITHRVIDTSVVKLTVTASGASILWPNWDKINALVEDVYPAKDRVGGILAEEARILVQNGTSNPLLIDQVANYLTRQNVQIIGYSPAARAEYPYTLVVDFGGTKTRSVMELTEWLSIAPEHILWQPASDQLDILLIIGNDFCGEVK